MWVSKNISNGLNGISVYKPILVRKSIKFQFTTCVCHICFLQSNISLGGANFYFDRRNSVCIFPFQMIAAIAKMCYEILKSTLISTYIHTFNRQVRSPNIQNWTATKLQHAFDDCLWVNLKFSGKIHFSLGSMHVNPTQAYAHTVKLLSNVCLHLKFYYISVNPQFTEHSSMFASERYTKLRFILNLAICKLDVVVGQAPRHTRII